MPKNTDMVNKVVSLAEQLKTAPLSQRPALHRQWREAYQNALKNARRSDGSREAVCQ